MVDGIADPRGGRVGFGEGLEGPVVLVGCALLDPTAEEGNLGLGEGIFLGLGRRHEFVGIVVRDAVKQFAVVRIARDDGGEAVVVGESAFAGVEAEVGFAFVLVRAVAEEALI